MEDTFTYLSDTTDAVAVFTRRWPVTNARAVVQIAHGMGEHSARYARLAAALNAAGYTVYAADHRGHGRTARDERQLGDFGDAGWNGVVGDMLTLGSRIDAESGGVPRVLLGHSMGSFALQQLLLDHSRTIAAAVLSGTSAVDALAGAVPADDTPADLSQFNVPFEPARTPSDWLSRDDSEVDKYIVDPLCGFGVSAAGLRSMAADAPRAADPEALRAIRSDLPLLMISGSADPLAGGLALVELVAQRYRDAGLTAVATKWYTDARHELFNETNRDTVTQDLIDWLASAV